MLKVGGGVNRVGSELRGLGLESIFSHFVPFWAFFYVGLTNYSPMANVFIKLKLVCYSASLNLPMI